MAQPETEVTLADWQASDVATLASLHGVKDNRTIEQMVAEESYSEYVLEAVDIPPPAPDGTRFATVKFDGWTTLLDVPKDKPDPRKGDILRMYDHGIGTVRFGYAINGEVYEFQTPWERFAARIKMLASHDRGSRESYVEQKANIEKWYAMLRGPFKARIDRFRSESPDFDIRGGSYEIYPTLMAQRIVDHIEEEDKVDPGNLDREEAVKLVRVFHGLPYDDQSAVIHAGEEDKYGISGHQFYSACGLAVAVLCGGDI